MVVCNAMAATRKSTHAFRLTGSVRGAAGFARPHRVDRAAGGGLEKVGAGGGGRGGGGIFAAVAFDALGRSLVPAGFLAFHHGRLTGERSARWWQASAQRHGKQRERPVDLACNRLGGGRVGENADLDLANSSTRERVRPLYVRPFVVRWFETSSFALVLKLPEGRLRVRCRAKGKVVGYTRAVALATRD